MVRRQGGEASADLVEIAVAVTRGTRTHPAVRTGASVRGAIDTVLIARELATVRGHDHSPTHPGDTTGLDAALVQPLAEAIGVIGARAAERGQEVPAARLALLRSVIEAFWWQRYTSDRGAMGRDEVQRILDEGA